MRVLFTTSEWPTHYFPMVPLGWALQAAGHEVRVACAPSQVEHVSRAGLTPLPVLGGPDPMFKTRLARYWEVTGAGQPVEPGSLLHPVTAEPLERPADFDFATYAALHRESNLELMRGSCDRTVDFARRWSPDLVVFDPQNVEGVLAARVLGVPAVCHLFGVVGTHETEPGLDIVLEDHSSSFARYAGPEMSADLIDSVVDHCPASAAPAVAKPRLPVRYVPYNGPGGVPEWATRPPESGRPRVLVAWGTSLTHVYGSRAFLAPMLLSALADADVEVVVTATERDRATLGPLPPNARLLEQWSPLRLLLPCSDAVIHYGSGGASMTATVTGVPQLALPFSAEQRMNARRLCAGGAGFVLDGFTATPDEVRDRIADLLTLPSHRLAAARLRDEALDRPTPAELVDTLRELAETAPWRAPGETEAPVLAAAVGSRPA
ncbi:MAG TPA: nucleotide disphospho-sugar-binding domain-containing protein [Rugosimonospora sp.]|nr:nucleotide disphospho-sugar-binding domain-containing protein [Rugosimonospora sp.]